MSEAAAGAGAAGAAAGEGAGAAGAAAGAAGAGASAAGAAGAGAGASASSAAGAVFDWKGAGLDDVGLATVNNKQWKGPADLLGSYVNLEKLVGVPPEQIIKLPKDMAPELMGEVYDRMGRPKTAAEYKLPVPDGGDPKFAETASTWFHEAGLSASQAAKVAAKWNEHIGGANKAQMDAYNTSVTADQNALKIKWGAEHDANHAIAKQAAAAFGLDAAKITGLEKTLGYAGVHELLYSIGSKIGEAEYVAGGGNPGAFAGMTPEAARAQITTLKSDRTFVARFNSADPVVRGEAKAEMDRLHQKAYPGVQVR
ncbi:MAG: hypothetical protein V4641_13050 [Pseudomonadota bacterium]